MTIVLFLAILVGVILIAKMVRGILRGIALFILVLALLITGSLVGVKLKPDMLPVSVHNHVLEVHAGKTDFKVSLDDVVTVDAISVDGKVQISGAAGGQLFSTKVNKWVYEFALKSMLEKQLGSKFKDKTSGF